MIISGSQTRAWRQELGIPSHVFAVVVGLNPGQLQNFEFGSFVPSEAVRVEIKHTLRDLTAAKRLIPDLSHAFLPSSPDFTSVIFLRRLLGAYRGERLPGQR